MKEENGEKRISKIIPYIGTRIDNWGSFAWNALGIVFFGFIILQILGKFQSLIPPILMALIIIYVLTPLVDLIERKGFSRNIGLAIAFGLLLAFVVFFIWMLVPALIAQLGNFNEQLPKILDDIESAINSVMEALGLAGQIEVKERAWDWIVKQNTELARYLQEVQGWSIGLISFMLNFFIAPVIAFYVIKHYRGIVHFLKDVSDKEGVFVELARRVNGAMKGYFQGTFLNIAIMMVIEATVLRIVGMNFWLLLAIFLGFTRLIPMIGAWLGALTVLMMAMLQGGVQLAFVAGIGMIFAELIDNYITSPFMLHTTVDLHPSTIMLALLIGTSVAGIWGLIIIVPIVGSLKQIFEFLWFDYPQMHERAKEKTAESLCD